MLRGVVSEHETAAGDRRQIPPGEDARAGVHVGFRESPHAHREEFHQLAGEVFLRTRADVGPAIEPHQHRRILCNRHEQISEISERRVAEELQLTPSAGASFTWPGGHHPGGFNGADLALDFGVRRREVVVPEQRHLFLQRTPTVHHTKQPPLACVGDVRRWTERRSDTNVGRMANHRIDVVGEGGVVDEMGGGGGKSQESEPCEGVRLLLGRAKRGATQEMVDFCFALPRHGCPWTQPRVNPTTQCDAELSVATRWLIGPSWLSGWSVR